MVLGGGNAALCAAITAARSGCHVIVVEGAPEFYRGGNTRHTRNLRLSHDGTAPTMTGPYAREEFLDDLYRVTGGQTDEALARLTVTRSSELLGWMDEQGVRFQPPLGGTLASARPTPSSSAAAVARSTRSTARRARSASASFTMRR